MSKTVANAAYLDHNATSPIRPEAFEAACEAMKMGGNPTSIHHSGRAARALVEEARAQVACLVEAEPSEILFTSGGTVPYPGRFLIFEGRYHHTQRQ